MLLRKLSFVALTGIALSMSSCGKENPLEDITEVVTGLTFDVTPNVTEAYVGDEITFSYKVTSNEKLKTLVITSNLTEIEEVTVDDFTENNHENTHTTVALPEVVKKSNSIDFTFVLTDKKGKSITKVVTIAINEKVVATPLTTEVTEGVVIYNIQGTEKGAWDLVTDVAVGSASDDTAKDLSNTTGDDAVFVAGFESKNGSQFVKVVDFDYAAATVESATAAFTAGTPAATVADVVEGDVFVVKLRASEDFAVIRITNVDVTEEEGNNLDKIEFTYKKK